MGKVMEAVLRWPRPPDFIPARALKEQAGNRWPAVRALLQRGDGDAWENLLLEGGMSLEDAARLLSGELGVPPEKFGEFARAAVAQYMDRKGR